MSAPTSAVSERSCARQELKEDQASSEEEEGEEDMGEMRY